MGGKFTWTSEKNAGVNDYMLASPCLFDCIDDFNVLDKLPESDHSALKIDIKCCMKYHSRPVVACRYRAGSEPMLAAHGSIASEGARLQLVTTCSHDNNKHTGNSVNDWEPHYRFIWNKHELNRLGSVINDSTSIEYRESFLDSLSNIEDIDTVATKFDSYISQACQRSFSIKKCHKKIIRKRSPWFDKQCRDLRYKAVKAGERIIEQSDRLEHQKACKAFKACKQRKKRNYKLKSINEMEFTFKQDPSKLWKTINNLHMDSEDSNQPSKKDLYEHFRNVKDSIDSNNFDLEYERSALNFLTDYGNGNIKMDCNSIEYDILNRNFTTEEVINGIDSLKNNKSPGTDMIPPEFVKCLKMNIKDDITNLFNHIITKGKFPRDWAEGLKSTIYKQGDKSDANNYRGINVPKIFEKLFEILIYNRLQFINEAFGHIDEFNGGFLSGRRTSDNIFILNGLIQKQLLLGKPLFVCFVDFSKAFDLINRHILFYKLMKNGWHGRVIDTLRDLYTKTVFRIKHNGKVSQIIDNLLGVNQGGTASGLLFRKYIQDISDYLKKEYGIVMGNTILAHLLWADDLILISDNLNGIKRQLDGLKLFCSKNQMIVNAIKTKIMVFGSNDRITLSFNENIIDQVDKYKYVGCIIKAVKKSNSDPFQLNYSYLCNQARKAIFSVKKN